MVKIELHGFITQSTSYKIIQKPSLPIKMIKLQDITFRELDYSGTHKIWYDPHYDFIDGCSLRVTLG